jgi:DNA sulfur modification protein DndD
MNVIIGDNGYGKSKLYDAFYWAMYDKCFDTNDKEWKKTHFIGRSIISDKTTHEAKDGLIRTSVKMTFRDKEKDTQFIVERVLTAQKINKEIIPDKESIEEVTFRQIAGMTGKLISNPGEVEKIKKKILPDNIRPYMWFQGEQVESIIDFGASDSLTNAINVLSNISRFDEIKELSDAWEKSALDQYHRKVKSLSTDKNKSDQLEGERDKIIERIKLLETDIRKLKDNIGNAEEEADKLVGKQEEATRIRELDVSRKSLESQLQQTSEEERVERVDLHKKMFSRRWVLKGTQELVKSFNDKYGKYQDIKLRKQAEAKVKLELENNILKEMQTRLPINVPEPVYVQKMLEQELCLICNRPADKGSDAWNNIKQLLERSLAKPQETGVKTSTLHNFEPDFRRLSQHGYAMEQDIHRIDDDINETFLRINRLDKRRRTLIDDLDKVKNDIANLVTETSIDPERAKHLINELQSKNDYANRFRTSLTRSQIELIQKQKDLKKIDDDLSELVKEDLPAWLEEKKQLLIDFKEIAYSTRDRVFKKLVKQLEDEANKHYHQMMQGNLSAKGIIKLVESTKGNFMPRLVDEFGNPLLQLNTGNIILIKLATIMAIISARQGSRDTDLYTLITDAPMSVFGEDYTIGFCKTVSTVYRQSIIMSKEFYKNETLRRQLLTDSNINLGKVYMISPSLPENERSNRNSLSTIIKALN